MAAKYSRSRLKSRSAMPQRKTRCPLLTMGTVFEGEDGWTFVNATTPLYITVRREYAENAIPGNPDHCVMAQAMRAAFGEQYQYEVGSGITKIVDLDEQVVVRFATPSIVAAHIAVYDKTGFWDLPPRMYRLAALPKSWHEVYTPGAIKKPKKGKKGPATKIVAGGKSSGTKTIVRGKKPTRKRSSSTRVITRHKVVGGRAVGGKKPAKKKAN